MNGIDSTQTILDAIQTGGLVAYLVISVLAFVRGWVYSAAIVQELKDQVRGLTDNLAEANKGMKAMAEAWEKRNEIEAARQDWDRRGRRGSE